MLSVAISFSAPGGCFTLVGENCRIQSADLLLAFETKRDAVLVVGKKRSNNGTQTPIDSGAGPRNSRLRLQRG